MSTKKRKILLLETRKTLITEVIFEKKLKALFFYNCNNCNYFFDNPEVETDDVNDEQIEKCPKCKSEQFVMNNNGI